MFCLLLHIKMMLKQGAEDEQRCTERVNPSHHRAGASGRIFCLSLAPSQRCRRGVSSHAKA